MTTHIDLIVNDICSDSEQENVKRTIVFALTSHYIGMSSNDTYSPAWVQANSGWCNTYNTYLECQRITRLSGSDALNVFDIEALAKQVKDACKARGFVTQQ